MAETLGSLQLTLDPTSLLISQFSDHLNHTNTFQLITDSYFMKRGSRYDAYAQLRESRLLSKRLKLDEDCPVSEIPTSENLKKEVNSDASLFKFEENLQVCEIPRSEYSPSVKKSVKFSAECDENVRICELPRSDYSPLRKKSVNFHGSPVKVDEIERVSEIPRYGFWKKSVKFHGNYGNNDENLQVSNIPRSEYSPPVKKPSMKFQGNAGKKQGYSVLAQSVPDFSSVLRKENRRPPPENGNVNRIPRFEKSATPPPPSMAKREKMCGSASKYGGGSKSVNTGEKQSGGGRMMMGRKSYASIEELKGLSIAASSAINGEIRGKKSNVLRKSTVFSTKYY